MSMLKKIGILLGIMLFLFIIILSAGVFIYRSLWFQRQLHPIEYKSLIFEYADEYDLDPYLVAAVIYAESKYVPDAVSHREAVGLMQIALPTGRWIAEKMKMEDYDDNMLYDPETNIMFGCWYLDNLRSQFGNDLIVILAAYNGGRGNVRSWLSNQEYSKDGQNLDYIPFRETREYVQRVLNKYWKYSSIYKASE